MVYLHHENFHSERGVDMPSQGEKIKELAERLERQVIIDALSKIESIEELKEFIEKLRAKNE